MWKVTSTVQQLHQRYQLHQCSKIPKGGLQMYGGGVHLARIQNILSLSGGSITEKCYELFGENGILKSLSVFSDWNVEFSRWWLSTEEFLFDRAENLYHQFVALPVIIQHVILLNIFVYFLWKILPRRISTRHLTAGTGRRWHTMVLSGFSHCDLPSLTFQLCLFMVIAPDLIQGFNERVVFFTILSASLASHIFPLMTDSLTRCLHRRRALNKQAQQQRNYKGFNGVNVALCYLALTLKPDMVISIRNQMLERDFSLRNLFCALMTFNVLALLVDIFVIPSAQSISHARDLGGLLAGVAVKYILCQTTFGRHHLKWNSRFKLCRRFN